MSLGRLLILGAGGHGKVVADTALLCGWDEVCFLDDRWPELVTVKDWIVTGALRDFENHLSEYDGVIVAIGDNEVRRFWQSKLSRFEAELPIVSVIHPSSVIARGVAIGAGCVCLAGAIINIDCNVGAGVIVNTASSVDHDCTLGEFTHVCPGVRLAGGVSIGKQGWIGIGSIVKECVDIGSKVTVGAGAVVISDVLSNSTVVGVPARIINQD